MSVCPLHNMIKRLLCRKGCKRNAKRTHTESQYCNIFGRSPQNCFFLLQMMTSLYSMWLCNYACIIQYVHCKTICRHLLKWILTSLQVHSRVYFWTAINDLFEKYSGVSPSLFLVTSKLNLKCLECKVILCKFMSRPLHCMSNIFYLLYIQRVQQ